jgi:hypothetical protein
MAAYIIYYIISAPIKRETLKEVSTAYCSVPHYTSVRFTSVFDLSKK